MPEKVYKNIKNFNLTVIIIFITAVLFCIFFQSNKISEIAKINPFTVDPYDAVGSIAIQICIAVSVLNLARYVSFKKEGYANIDKLTFTLRGCFIIVLSIVSTLVTDLAAEVKAPTWSISILGKTLIIEIGFMGLLTLILI